MGSVLVEQIAFGKNYQEAYKNACREAEEEYGHQQGYSGQINSTNHCTLLEGPSRVGTKKFIKWLDNYVDTLDKRDVVAFEITGKLAIEEKKKHGLSRTHNKVFLLTGWAAD